MAMLTFTGKEAVQIALAASRQTEARIDGDPSEPWRPVSNFRARTIASRRPHDLRLRVDSRMLIETLVGTGIPTGLNEKEFAQTVRSKITEPSRRSALDIVLSRL